jgi:hypothetical protein
MGSSLLEMSDAYAFFQFGSASRRTPQTAATDLFKLFLSRLKHVSEFLQQLMGFSVHTTSAALLLLLLFCVDHEWQRQVESRLRILTRDSVQ